MPHTMSRRYVSSIGSRRATHHRAYRQQQRRSPVDPNLLLKMGYPRFRDAVVTLNDWPRVSPSQGQSHVCGTVADDGLDHKAAARSATPRSRDNVSHEITVMRLSSAALMRPVTLPNALVLSRRSTERERRARGWSWNR